MPEFRQRNGEWSYSITERVDGRWVKTSMGGFDSKEKAIKAYESRQRHERYKDGKDDEETTIES